jgi:hypothetical protein
VEDSQRHVKRWNEYSGLNRYAVQATVIVEPKLPHIAAIKGRCGG